MKLGKYKGIEMKRPVLEVSEEEIEKFLKRQQKMHRIERHIDDDSVEGGIRKEIELPAIDDDLALDYSDCDSLEEWKAVIYEMLKERREESVMERAEREILEKIAAGSEIEPDEELTEAIKEELMDELYDRLDEYNMSMESYLRRVRLTEDELEERYYKKAEETLRAQQVLHAVADVENISVSAEEFSLIIADMAEDYGEDAEEFYDALDEEEAAAILDEARMDKALELILEHVIWI